MKQCLSRGCHPDDPGCTSPRDQRGRCWRCATLAPQARFHRRGRQNPGWQLWCDRPSSAWLACTSTTATPPNDWHWYDPRCRPCRHWQPHPGRWTTTSPACRSNQTHRPSPAVPWRTMCGANRPPPKQPRREQRDEEQQTRPRPRGKRGGTRSFDAPWSTVLPVPFHACPQPCPVKTGRIASRW